MLKACEKRPITVDVIEGFISNLEREFQERGDKEISSTEIGEKVIRKLYEVDEVAYVRFASVYRSFKDVNQFMDELKDLLKDKEIDSKS
jgi:transcriptional repressor NrdR